MQLKLLMKDKNKELCLRLAYAESEEEVVKILKDFEYWDDEKNWKEVDESRGNWATIGNQQKTADFALVEKIINSVDAVLMKECQKKGINPESENAPKSIAEAQKEYFNIHNGKLSSIDSSIRSKLAENIYLVTTGEKGYKANPCYSIVDLGEGQAPECFKSTFLSLTKDNKATIQFVQGKFGMGGTGVLRFGSPEHNLQLIISRRNPEARRESESDKWGFTIMRRKNPIGRMKSSVFTYLAPEGKIISFNSQSLALLPNDNLEMYSKELKYGTYIKIYEYQIGTGRLRSDSTRHLHNRLSLLMPNIALPIKIVDVRYKKSPIKTLAGLGVRLDEDKRENLEEGFPSTGELIIKGQKMFYSVYAFKPKKRETYAGEEGIIFTVNGQTQGYLTKRFFERTSVGMNYLSDSILIVVDCSQTSRRMQEDLFMNSRDRLGGGELQSDIENKLEDIIKNHTGLRELKQRRRSELVQDRLMDDKPLGDILQKIVRKHPLLSKLFNKGVRISNPFKMIQITEQEKFEGKQFPTYFKLAKEYSIQKPKICPINRRFRIQFETDAENDFFNRDKDPGIFNLELDNLQIEDYSLNLWNGLATLNVALPQDVDIGDYLFYHTKVEDISKPEPFLNMFYVKVDNPQNSESGYKGKRKNPPGENNGKSRQKQSLLDIPNPNPIRKDKWKDHGFNEKSALKVYPNEENSYDFYINMDNIYLQTELKTNTKMEPKLIEAKFQYGMVLIGVSMLYYEKQRNREEDTPTKNDEERNIYDKIFMVSEALAPILLPMIDSLGNLDLND